MTNEEIGKVIQSAIAGKQIQCKYLTGADVWLDCEKPMWNFQSYAYRVKPEPRRCWGIRYSDGSWNYADSINHYYLTTAKDDGATEVVEFVEVLK